MKPTPRRILCQLRMPILLVVSVFLAACILENPGESQPKPQPETHTQVDTIPPASEREALLGSWLEKMPDNVLYFAGYRLELDFGRDSLDLLFHQWTDVILCTTEEDGTVLCDKNLWIDAYRGSWTLQDSILRIECRQTLAGKTTSVDTARHQVEFRIMPGAGDTLRLAHQGNAGDFLSERMNIRLHRVQALPLTF